MKKLRALLLSITTIISLVAVPLLPVTAQADCSTTSGSSNPVDSISGGVQCVGGKSPSTTEFTNNLKIIVNVLLFLLGSIAVIMIILGGIRYTTSNGDSSQITSAKNTILYAVIGLVIAILAYAIVNFVLSAFKQS